jgi:hypothetical protein
MSIQSIRSSRYGRLGLLGLAVSATTMGVGFFGSAAAEAATVHPAANYYVLWDTDIPNPQACIDEGEALVENGTAYTYKCTGGGVDYSLYIIRND